MHLTRDRKEEGVRNTLAKNAFIGGMKKETAVRKETKGGKEDAVKIKKLRLNSRQTKPMEIKK